MLSKHGYVIQKDQYTNSFLMEIRKDLTIQPFVENADIFGIPPSFKIYRETDKRLYLPRHYALTKQQLGSPKTDVLETGDTIRITPMDGFKLRAYQTPVMIPILKHLQESDIQGGILSVYCGWGYVYVFSLWYYLLIVYLEKPLQHYG